MFIYALSGILMIFRNTNFLKKEIITEQQLAPNLSDTQLKPVFKKGADVIKEEAGVLYLKGGTYNKQTGLAVIKKQELPFILNKMEKLHKATTDRIVLYIF